MNVDTPRFRMTALGVVVACLFGALFVRLWYLQVLESGQFKVATQRNGEQLVYTAAPRGRILDRNGKVIVDNQVVNELAVSRPVIKKHPLAVTELAALLGQPAETIKLAILDPRFSDLAPVPIAQPTADQMTYVKEHTDQFPGVSIVPEVVRTYPYGSLAAHMLGYVGQVNPAELAAHKGQGYRNGDEIGKAGVELAYDAQLRGTPGVTKYHVDSNGNLIDKIESQAPAQGHDLRLSIDINFQNLAEDSLYQGLKVAQGTVDRVRNSQFAGLDYPAPAGAAIVINPQNGQVLALASQPTYNPSVFTGGISDSEYQQLTASTSNQPLEDRATSGLYAPGSTFKLVTATAGLDRGLITPGTPYADKGYIKIGGQRFNNDGGAAYGTINLQTAITVSDDSYFYTLGADFWQGGKSLALQDTAHAYGFGAPTGLPIGGESSGLVPDPTSRRKEFQRYPNLYATGTWFTGDNINLAVGQGELTVTPLQLANAYAAFANGGTLYQPQVAVDTENQQGQKILSVPPKPIRQVPLSPSDRAAMLAGFQGVVADGNGTAHGAFKGWPFAGLAVAGKTGTAQVQGKEPTSVFVCWAPANNPQYLVAVIEEQAGYGASAAAPLARRILGGLYGLPTPAPVYVQGAAVN